MYGTITDNVNNESISDDPVHISSTDVNETTIYYYITGLHPSLNYTFTASLYNLLDSRRNEDHVTFSKSIVVMPY